MTFTDAGPEEYAPVELVVFVPAAAIFGSDSPLLVPGFGVQVELDRNVLCVGAWSGSNPVAPWCSTG